MLNDKYLKLSIILFLIILLVLLKIYVLDSKSVIDENNNSNFSVELTETEITNIQNWVLENSKKTNGDLDLNNF